MFPTENVELRSVVKLDSNGIVYSKVNKLTQLSNLDLETIVLTIENFL